MTYAAPRFSERKHHLVTTATMVVLFWTIAAVLVLAAHQRIGPISPAAAVTVEIASIVLVAFSYIRLTARDATVDHALFVGIIWTVFGIVAEITATTIGGRRWFELLGTPARPMLRDLLLFAWIAAPALFARARSSRPLPSSSVRSQCLWEPLSSRASRRTLPAHSSTS
jgi:hypothetical protein